MTWLLIKELLIVVILGSLVFRLGEPIAIRFSMPADFRRRRNIWFVLTITAFISQSFWIYCLIAIPLMVWAGKKDASPLALYLLLLHVVPPVPVSIPIIGAHGLFELDNYRLLSLFVLVPAAIRYRADSKLRQTRKIDTMDVLLAGWTILHVAIFIPPDLPNHVILEDSTTNMMRRGFLFSLDTLVVYYVASRSITTRQGILDALAAFCVSASVMAAIALFEYGRHWLLYADLATMWTGNAETGFYLLRGDALRAQVSAGHPLALGYLLAIAFGFWLVLKDNVSSKKWRVIVGTLFWGGLFAAYSRGPWIGALAIYLIYTVFGPQKIGRILKSIAIIGVCFGALLATPIGNRIISVLPFVGGTVDSGSVTYRESLTSRAVEIVEQKPWFGDQLAYQKMEDLRQGQGIIDLVNTYAEIGLFYGLVGLTFFILFGLSACKRAYSSASHNIKIDQELSLIGFDILACLLGTLLMLVSCSFIFGYVEIFYVLAGLANAYGRFAQRKTSPVRRENIQSMRVSAR
jgi:hypothetical protein